VFNVLFKKVNNRKIKTLVLLSCFPSCLMAIDSAPQKNHALNLNDFLELMIANDPVYQQLEINKQKTVFIIDEGITGNAYQLNMETQYGFGDDDVNTKSLSASLSKEILETGTQLSISHSTNENPDRDEDVSEVQIEQDLLKNAFGKEHDLQKGILSKTQELERLMALENYERYIATKIKLYLDFSQAAIEVELSQSLLKAAQDLYAHIDNKFKKNAANSTDIKRARLQVILKEQDFLAKKEQLDAIKQTVLLSLNLDDDKLYPELGLDLYVVYGEETSVFDIKKFRQFQIANLKHEIIMKEYELTKDHDLAQLSLLGGYKIDESTRFANSVNRNETSVGLRLAMPFKDNNANAQKKIKALDLKYGDLDQLRTTKELRIEYENTKLKLEKLKKQFLLSKEKEGLMKSVLQEETIRYQRGRIDTDKIIEVNNTYAQYQFEKNQSMLELNKSYLDWLVLNDRLISAL